MNNNATEPGGLAPAALYEQIFRYAEDLQEMIERHEALQAKYDAQRQQDSRLLESRAVLDALTLTSNDIHLTTDLQGIIVESNPAASAFATRQRLAGSNLKAWVLPTHLENFLTLRAAAIAQSDVSGEEFELSLRGENDAPPLAFMARIVTTRMDGAVHELHWVLRDVTHPRETELETQIFSMVFKGAAEGMLITDTEGKIRGVNPAFVRIIGHSAEETVGRNARFLVADPQAAVFDANFWQALKSTSHWQGEMLSQRKDGEPLSLWLTIKAARDAHGQILSFLLVLSNIPNRSTVERRVMVTDPEGTIIAVNQAFTQYTGYTASEALGCNPRFRSSALQDHGFYENFWRSLIETGQWQGELLNRKKSGEIYPEHLSIKGARDGNGRIISYIAIFSDIPNLLNTESRLSYLAHHDSLTGLPNRLLFQDRLGQALTQSRRSKEPFTLIFVDLDNFKSINDKLGHAVGDRVLQEAARRLAGTLREVDTVARLGGDEFVIVAPGLVGEAFIGRLCAKAIEALNRPLNVIGQVLYIQGSFGCAEYPRHGTDEVSLLKSADTAMYQAKASGGNTYVIFDASAPPLSLPGENS